ncbi:MAG: hypothetical protein IPL40_05865 [Proteobacteria bacterium]|nr:hypothetical protein [Pseudomonadota bacterium]
MKTLAKLVTAGALALATLAPAQSRAKVVAAYPGATAPRTSAVDGREVRTVGRMLLRIQREIKNPGPASGTPDEQARLKATATKEARSSMIGAVRELRKNVGQLTAPDLKQMKKLLGRVAGRKITHLAGRTGTGGSRVDVLNIGKPSGGNEDATTVTMTRDPQGQLTGFAMRVGQEHQMLEKDPSGNPVPPATLKVSFPSGNSPGPFGGAAQQLGPQ